MAVATEPKRTVNKGDYRKMKTQDISDRTTGPAAIWIKTLLAWVWSRLGLNVDPTTDMGVRIVADAMDTSLARLGVNSPISTITGSTASLPERSLVETRFAAIHGEPIVNLGPTRSGWVAPDRQRVESLAVLVRKGPSHRRENTKDQKCWETFKYYPYDTFVSVIGQRLRRYGQR